VKNAATTSVSAVEARASGGEFSDRVIELSGQPVSACYHCQRCGGGCPVAEAAGITPSEFLRLLSLGLSSEAVASRLLWLCVGCSTCGARCPNGISTNEVIDQIRAEVSARQDIAQDTKDIRTFHRLFLTQIRYLGRQHEVFLMGALKVSTGKLLKDLDLGLKMFRKGKLPLFPHRAAGIPAVRSIFRRRGGRK